MKTRSYICTPNAVPNFDIVFSKRDQALAAQGLDQATQIQIVMKQSESLQTLREVFDNSEEPAAYYTRA